MVHNGPNTVQIVEFMQKATLLRFPNSVIFFVQLISFNYVAIHNGVKIDAFAKKSHASFFLDIDRNDHSVCVKLNRL